MQHARKRMACRVALAGALVACAAALLPSAAPAGRTVGSPCPGASLARCLTVPVPLDRSGRVPGRVSLHVAVLPAAGTPRGVVFLIAGGPGQAASELFDFGQPLIRGLYGAAFPGYTLVAFDARGTGKSGALRCPVLEADRPDEGSKVAQCAKALGARRDFYGTPDQAADVDAVRQALGYDSIALAAVSYGTELAVEYARAFPDHVSRLMLDSVALLDHPDPLATGALSRVPSTLRRFCAGGECKSATSDFAGDVAALARRLEAAPLRGSVLQRSGGRHSASLDKEDFLSMLLDADLNVGLALELPAAVHAARYGNAGPILRLANLDSIGGGGNDLGVNDGVYLATICRDGGFPWPPDASLAQRRQLIASAVKSLPASALGGFGRWATDFGSASSCLEWPTPTGGTARATAPLPDVPVLVLSGAFDLRTPTDNATALVKQFRNAKLVVVPRVGHSALTNDLSGCAIRAVRAWAMGESVETHCPRTKPLFPAVPAYAAVATPAGAKQTHDLAQAALSEAIATWLMTGAIDGKKSTVTGVAHGTASSGLTSIELNGYATVTGVWLTGRISLSLTNPYAGFSGSVSIAGPNAAAGTLIVEGDSLHGVLGGKSVG